MNCKNSQNLWYLLVVPIWKSIFICVTLLIFHPPAHLCLNIASFPKSSLFSRNSFMLFFTITIWSSLFITSCIHSGIIPPILTLSLCVGWLALANGMLANETQAKAWEGLMFWGLLCHVALWNSHIRAGRSLVKPIGEWACGTDISHFQLRLL